MPFSPPPQLRYSVADRWLTLEARRNDLRGNDQFCVARLSFAPSSV
jgi:hypothetical protein